MCGIIGFATLGHELVCDRVAALRDTMAHRGPDDVGIWASSDGRLVVGHLRLAIVDLSDLGHQPMVDNDTGVVLVFNGEIYNHRALRRRLKELGHRFRSAFSDTEVLLEAYKEWGIGCLDELNAMFSFAVYDPRDRSIFLARDRCGEKPLFITHSNGRFGFASEIKGLLETGSTERRVDGESLEEYLAYGYVNAPRTMFSGISKLGAGQAARYGLDEGVLRVWDYWRLPEPGPGDGIEDHLSTIERLLEDSVALRLMADVPVGVLLSGGLDSSLVTAMAARHSTRSVKTFTVTFGGHDRYDEAEHAKLVGAHFGTDHLELQPEPASVDILPVLARQFDDPIADSSMIPTYLVSRLIREHATVALGGDGADELYGGYLHYGWGRRQETALRLVPPVVRRAVAGLAGMFPTGLPGRNQAMSIGDPDGIIYAPNRYFDELARHRLLPGRSPSRLPEEERVAHLSAEYSALQRMTRTDFGTYLPNDILVKVDRSSMLSSLEVRSPWLDHRLVEHAFGRIPDGLKASYKKRKIVLRHLAQRVLPRQFDASRKQGFSIPLADWLGAEPWSSAMREILLTGDATFNQREVRRLFALQERGFRNEQRIFSLAMFELWRQNYGVVVEA